MALSGTLHLSDALLGRRTRRPTRKPPTRRIPPVGPRAAAAAAASAPSNSDYTSMLQNEPLYTADTAALAGQDVADTAQRRAAIQSLIAQYGGLPEGFTDPYGDVTSAVLDAAKKNPYSTTAQLARERDSSRSSMIADRAARGVLGSGGTQLQEKEIGYQFGKAQYDALNQLMSQINGIEGNYADAARQRALQAAGYLGDAQQRLLDAGYYPAASKPSVNASAPYKPFGYQPTFHPGVLGIPTMSFTGHPIDLTGVPTSLADFLKSRGITR